MGNEILESWENIERYLMNVYFDGASESRENPWFAESDLEGFYGLVGKGVTPLAAVQNFMLQLDTLRVYNNKNHGVKR
jgi:hypothetical protein